MMSIENNKKKKQIAILGSTGSIGTQALQVIEEHPDLYEPYALTANNRVELLIAQARKFQPEVVVIANEAKCMQVLMLFARLWKPDRLTWCLLPWSDMPG